MLEKEGGEGGHFNLVTALDQSSADKGRQRQQREIQKCKVRKTQLRFFENYSLLTVVDRSSANEGR